MAIDGSGTLSNFGLGQESRGTGAFFGPIVYASHPYHR